MITIESYYNASLGAQNFIIRVPDKDIAEMDFNEEERELILQAQENESALSALKVLLVIVQKGTKNG